MSQERKLEKISLDKLGVPAENLRRHNVDLEMDDLETNIHVLGQSQAILVYESPDNEGMYEVIDGQRRLNAFVNLNKKYPDGGYDKIYAMIRDEPNDSDERKAISLGANYNSLEMTSDDTMQGVIDLYLVRSSMSYVAEKFGLTEKTVKKYVKSARLDERLRKAQVSGEITDDPDKALDAIMTAVDLLNWTEENEVSDDKVIESAKIIANAKTKAEEGDIIEEIKKDPYQEVGEIPGKIKNKKTKTITRKVVLPPETDKQLVTYAKSGEIKRKPEDAGALILISALKKLVSQDEE
jgi:ParB-like chromosome segregation protein Spo0J